MIDLEAHGLIPPATPPSDPGGPRTIGHLLDPLVADDPDRIVLVGRHGRLSAAALDEAATRAACALRSLGAGPGSRVAATLPNDVPIVVAFLGAMKVGAIWVGVNRPLAAPEKAYMLQDSETSVFLGDPATVDELRTHRPELSDLTRWVTVDPGGDRDEWSQVLEEVAASPEQVEVDRSWPAAISYTSGTTGFPKGAVHTQHNLLLPGTVGARRAAELGVPPGVAGVALPLTILNLMILGPLAAYQSGSRLVAMDRIDAVGMATWIAEEGITTFAAVPAMVHDLLTHPEVDDSMLASIEAIGVGGAAMPDAFRELYQQRFGRRVGTGYGLTEAPTSVTAEDVTLPPVPGSCGRALPQIRLSILDESDREVPSGEVGEVCVGPATDGELADVYRPMLGYWNRAEESRQALRGGLLHTGDLGCLDEEGNLFIKDRKHDLILRGGANVYPAEVERVLHDDQRVAACAVVGAPDERLGERVVAFVQVEPDAAVDPEDLREHCRGQLARYKVPDVIEIIDGFDRTPMGKIRKQGLRQRAAEAIATQQPAASGLLRDEVRPTPT
jgi:long-chain acyl-CoA synthetase